MRNIQLKAQVGDHVLDRHSGQTGQVVAVHLPRQDSLVGMPTYDIVLHRGGFMSITDSNPPLEVLASAPAQHKAAARAISAEDAAIIAELEAAGMHEDAARFRAALLSE